MHNIKPGMLKSIDTQSVNNLIRMRSRQRAHMADVGVSMTLLRLRPMRIRCSILYFSAHDF